MVHKHRDFILIQILMVKAVQEKNGDEDELIGLPILSRMQWNVKYPLLIHY